MSVAFFRREHSRCAALFAAVLIPSLIVASAHAAGSTNNFSVTPAQLQSLGVQLQRLVANGEVAGLTYAAQVVLPPTQQRLVSAPLAGVIDQLLVAEHDAVKPGQPLLRLLSPELGELQLKLMEAGARSGLAAQTLQRERALFAEGIIPERRVQEAATVAAEQLARRRQAEAALRLAGLDDAAIRRIADGGADGGVINSTLIVRARSAGLVSELSVKPGQRVQQADAMLQIADSRRLWLDVQLPLARQAEVATVKGAKISVLGHLGGASVTATVLSLGSAASNGQTVTLRAEVTQGAASLRVGELVQVRLPFASSSSSTGSSTGQGWAVPLQAVARQGDKAYVFVRTEQGFVAQPVTILASGGQTLLVSGDLEAGQQIAIASVIALKAAWQGKSGAN